MKKMFNRLVVVVVLHYLWYLCILPLTHEITAALLHCIIQVSSDMVVRRRDSGGNLVRASYLHMIYRIVNDCRIITSNTHIDLFAHHILDRSQWFQVT